MTAIAQTLNGKETFETKKELFDYVFQQLEGMYYVDLFNTIGETIRI